MGILSWIIFGLIAGALAKMILPGKEPQGCVITIILGVLGSVVGGFVGTQLGWGKVTGFDLRSFGLAVIGGVILLGVFRAIKS